MSTDAVIAQGTPKAATPIPGPGHITLSISIAWRNLWRNRRRTWLSTGGVAFSVFIMVFAWSTQVGTFRVMMENATSLMTGHLQLSHPLSIDDPALRHTVTGASELAARIERHPEVLAVSVRGMAFGLISTEERGFGGQIMGVDPRAESRLSTLSNRITQGRYLAAAGEAVLGVALAKNLGLSSGEEVVVLGSAREGSIAALAATVVGILQTDVPELDRSLMLVHLSEFQDAFGLADEGHIVVVKLTDLELAEPVRSELLQGENASELSGLALRTWKELLPELQQLVDMKKAGQQVFFVLLGIMVTFSTFNTFAMTVFERSREFGVLLALGMRPKGIILMLQVEAALLCLLGIGLGLAISIALVQVLSQVGIPLGDQLGELMRQYQLPNRFYPALTAGALVPGPLLMFIGLQLAALIPALRVRHMRPAEAIRMGG